MRIIVCGSRTWDDASTVRRAVYNAALDAEPEGPITIVHGGARGADTIAAAFASGAGVPVEAHPADWNRWGKAAGPIRNREMLDAGADLVLAFQRAGSRGTQDMIDRARAAGVPVRVYTADAPASRADDEGVREGANEGVAAPAPRAKGDR